MLRQLPPQSHPDLLVGFSTGDDAGVFALPGGQAIVQTLDFFTPIVDDPFAFGQIAAANALSDVYAMGGRPITVMNIACFDPEAAPAEVWADIFMGMAAKTAEAGAVIIGGHTVEDSEPKFGLSVTGIVQQDQVVTNASGKPGQTVWLSKPLGTGIVSTAGKNDKATQEETEAAISTMATLNRAAAETAVAHGVTCGTDITGFGLAGHLWNIARESTLAIEVSASALPLLPGVERMVSEHAVPGGAYKNLQALEGRLTVHPDVPDWLKMLAVDPQTSGGLCVLSDAPLPGYVQIGTAVQAEPSVRLLP